MGGGIFPLAHHLLLCSHGVCAGVVLHATLILVILQGFLEFGDHRLALGLHDVPQALAAHFGRGGRGGMSPHVK